MDELLEIYASINSLEGLKKYKAETSDGESHFLEAKAIKYDLNTAQKSTVGDTKLMIAKEMSAFANTSGGIIIIGVDDNFEVENKTNGLLDWLDRNERDMLEPTLSGIKKKVCKDVGGEFVALLIPSGDTPPYRVKSVSASSDKRIAREYYQRVGTNSEPIPESIVRHMYLSRDRAVNISIFPEIIYAGLDEAQERRIIRLGLKVKSDETRLIDKYYLSSQAYLLDNSFNRLTREPVTVSEQQVMSKVIPPSNKVFTLGTLDIRQAVNTKQSSSLYSVIDTDNMDFAGTETVGARTFNNLCAIHIVTEYACDGMPMKVENRIIVLGDKRDISAAHRPAESDWIDDRCRVVRYIDFSPEKNREIMYAMEGYIRKNINHEDGV